MTDHPLLLSLDGALQLSRLRMSPLYRLRRLPTSRCSRDNHCPQLGPPQLLPPPAQSPAVIDTRELNVHR